VTLEWGECQTEHRVSNKPIATIAMMGIDIGKNSFHVLGLDQRRDRAAAEWSRGQIEARLANLPPCLIGMEACVGTHHLSRGVEVDDALEIENRL
jgi:transposase